MRNFPDGGYTVIISDRRAPAGDFDHGPLGSLSIAAHGHADALSFGFIATICMIVDTYLYHAGGACANICAPPLPQHTQIEDQSQHQFRAQLAAQGQRATEYSDGRSLTDGYRRQFGIDHERAVTKSGDGIIIEDRLVGAAVPLRVKIRFLVNPQLEVLAGDEAVISRHGGTILSLKAPDGFTTKVVKPRERKPGQLVLPGLAAKRHGDDEGRSSHANDCSLEKFTSSASVGRTFLSIVG